MSAANTWLYTILPTVFPYLIISKFIAVSDIFDSILKIPGKFIAIILKINYKSAKCFLTSMICGYPAGAIAASSLYESGEISEDEAQKIISFSNNAGPLFLISAIGGGLLDSPKTGLAIYIIQIISAFVYGLLQPKTHLYKKSITKYRVKNNFDFTDAVSQSVVTIMNICAFMIVSYVLAESVIIFIGFFISDMYLSGIFIKSFFEISAGIKTIADCIYDIPKIPLICAVVSWSGFSVIMQIAYASKRIVSIKKLMYAKLTQSLISFGLGTCYIKLFGIKSHNYNNINMINISLIFSIALFLIYLISSIIRSHSKTKNYNI